MNFYRLRNKETGEFSIGGRYFTSTNKKGKLWFDKKTLVRGLKYSVNDEKGYCKAGKYWAAGKEMEDLEERFHKAETLSLFDSWEVVEYEVTEINTIDPKTLLG